MNGGYGPDSKKSKTKLDKFGCVKDSTKPWQWKHASMQNVQALAGKCDWTLEVPFNECSSELKCLRFLLGRSGESRSAVEISRDPTCQNARCLVETRILGYARAITESVGSKSLVVMLVLGSYHIDSFFHLRQGRLNSDDLMNRPNMLIPDPSRSYTLFMNCIKIF